MKTGSEEVLFVLDKPWERRLAAIALFGTGLALVGLNTDKPQEEPVAAVQTDTVQKNAEEQKVQTPETAPVIKEPRWATPRLSRWYPDIDAALEQIGKSEEVVISRDDVLAMIALESDGDENVGTSSTGAEGLTQLMPIAIKQIEMDTGVTVDPKNSREAIFGGTHLLNKLATRGGVGRSVLAYFDGHFGDNTPRALDYQVKFSALRLGLVDSVDDVRQPNFADEHRYLQLG